MTYAQLILSFAAMGLFATSILFSRDNRLLGTRQVIDRRRFKYRPVGRS